MERERNFHLFDYPVPTAHKTHKKNWHTSSKENFHVNCPQIVKM